MQLVGVAYRAADLADGKVCGFQLFGSLGHAEMDQEFLGALGEGLLKDFSEIAAVQAAASGHIFHSDVLCIVLFNETDSFTHIKIPQPAFLKAFFGR